MKPSIFLKGIYKYKSGIYSDYVDMPRVKKNLFQSLTSMFGGQALARAIMYLE